MDESKPPILSVVPGSGGNVVPLRTPGEKVSPPPPPGLKSEREIEVWEYICAQLRQAGIEHRTFGLAAAVVCSVYVEWMDSRVLLDEFKAQNGGSYMTTTPNGYQQPHQVFYVVEKLRRDLLQWLPECCLTIPAYATAKSKLGVDDGQRDLPLEDLVEHAIADRESYARR
jgi:hypothetical protein